MALTVEVTAIAEGYTIRRSDGGSFFLPGIGNTGNAVLYHGAYAGIRTSAGIVELDYTVADKIAAARDWVLAFPDHPPV